jgi:hypothetical protein
MPDDAAPPPPESKSSDTPPEPSGPDALAEALRRVAEAREYLVYLLAAEIDRFKLRLRRAAMWAVVGITALVILLALLVAAAGLVLVGVAQWLGELMGGRMWLGSLLTGAGVLVLGAAAVAFGLWSWQRSAYEATRERFAARRRRQRGKFGRSVNPSDEAD